MYLIQQLTVIQYIKKLRFKNGHTYTDIDPGKNLIRKLRHLYITYFLPRFQ